MQKRSAQPDLLQGTDIQFEDRRQRHQDHDHPGHDVRHACEFVEGHHINTGGLRGWVPPRVARRCALKDRREGACNHCRGDEDAHAPEEHGEPPIACCEDAEVEKEDGPFRGGDGEVVEEGPDEVGLGIKSECRSLHQWDQSLTLRAEILSKGPSGSVLPTLAATPAIRGTGCVQQSGPRSKAQDIYARTRDTNCTKRKGE